MLITDPQEIEGVLHALNAGNQIFKNAKKDKSYLILQGKFIAIKSGYECSDAVGTLKLPSTKKYHDGYDLVDNMTGYIADGPKLYNYIKDFKKDVNEIVIGKNHFKISTRYGDVFESVTDSNEFQKHLYQYNEYNKKVENIIDKSNGKKLFKELTQEELEEFLKNRYTTTINIGKEKIIVTPKLFTSIKAKSKLSLEVYAITKEIRLCKASLVNKDSDIDFTFAFSKF